MSMRHGNALLLLVVSLFMCCLDPDEIKTNEVTAKEDTVTVSSEPIEPIPQPLSALPVEDGFAIAPDHLRPVPMIIRRGGGGVNRRRSVVPSCTDNKKNQDESDVDCGGNICPPCMTEQQCLEDEDCLTGECVDGACICTGSNEICDGFDNDCDGVVDNGNFAQSCGVGGCMRSVDCVDGMIDECVPGMPSSEVCDGIDNNCDGAVDDGDLSITCGTGACERSVNCEGGVIEECIAGTPGTEVCNGIDDDCDGSTDENLSCVAIVIADAMIVEGNAGQSAMIFTVSLSAATIGIVQVNFTTLDGTASAPSDYIQDAGVVTFLPGEINKLVNININGDTEPEANETFTVALSIPTSNAFIADGIGEGTITNDDEAACIVFGQPCDGSVPCCNSELVSCVNGACLIPPLAR